MVGFIPFIQQFLELMADWMFFGHFQLKKHQQKIEMILDSKRIDYDKIDIAGNDEAKNKMREIMGDPHGLPPQLTKGNAYLGVS